jgi:hypothetical protein
MIKLKTKKIQNCIAHVVNSETEFIWWLLLARETMNNWFFYHDKHICFYQNRVVSYNRDLRFINKLVNYSHVAVVQD